APPDSVIAWVRPVGPGWFRRFPMRRVGAYDYRATVPADTFPEGVYRWVVSVRQGAATTTYPQGVSGAPWDWDFQADEFWHTTVVPPSAPLRLLRPAEDVPLLAFTRIGDGGRTGLFRLVNSAATGEPALHLELPVNDRGESPEDYTASLVVLDRIAGRGESLAGATGVRVRLRGIGARQRLHLTLMERDGTSWSAALEPGTAWSEPTIPLAAFRPARGVKLPLGFPGRWNYWVEPAAGRGAPGDALRLADVERLQLSLRREEGLAVQPGSYGVEVESVTVVFE
ncbi:MAG TPA: hypothetical protein VEW03_02120, partial [Longimicrobiaceae bacterium]|nr:hypothetical protein [Longimicrobiaceae bacterium]